MEKRWLVFAFVGWWLLQGCVADEGGVRDPEVVVEHPEVTDAASDFMPDMPDLRLNPDRADGGSDPYPVWLPRSHPQGTLLVDAVDELWMVGEHGTRLPVSGDDTLGMVSLDEADAIPMSAEEERCLVPNMERYWDPGNGYWWPVYGLSEDDLGPFILDGEDFTRRPVSIEALESWGYYWRWMDYFDGGEDEWLSYTFVDEPIGFRDGSLARTELGIYYLLHGRAYLFRPAELALEAGYLEADMQMMTERRLRELAIVTTSFRHETFNLCPAETP